MSTSSKVQIYDTTLRVENEGLSYEYTPSGIDNISVILREQDITPE